MTHAAQLGRLIVISGREQRGAYPPARNPILASRGSTSAQK